MNILMIITDQMHKYAMGCINDQIITPNLDKLASEGVLFNNAYSNNPSCCPYRGSLFTGLYSRSNGIVRNGDPISPNIRTLADELNQEGYDTSFVGKWHLGGEGNRPITEDLRGGFRHFMGYQCHNGYLNEVCFYDEENKEHRYNKHRTNVTTDIADERLRKLAEGDKPFLHVVIYQAPHYPTQPSQEFAELYKGTQFQLPPNYQDIDPYTPTFNPPSPKPVEKCPDYQKYGNNIQEYLSLYYGMVSQIDHGVGKLLNTLDELNIRDETLVLFSADHGDMQGSHGLKNKDVPYEKSCSVPLIISSANCIKGRQIQDPVSSIDFFPTLLNVAGIEASEKLPGRDLSPYMTGNEINVDTPVFAESFTHKTPWDMVRTKKYKLSVKKDEVTPWMMYDIENDPYEMNDIKDDEKYATACDELMRELQKWREQY